MSYKIIILDLDDTLLLNNGKISEGNKKALKLVQERGIKVVLASGRPTFAMRNIADELELNKYGGYIISYNGSRIVDCKTNEVIYEVDLTKKQVEELYRLALKYETFIHTYNGDEILTCHDNPYTYIESEITGMKISMCENFVESLPDKCVKVIMLQAPNHLKEVEEMLKPQIKDKMTMNITKPFFLEFMNKETDKSKSIIRLCEKLNINIEDTIAIGDSYNDISMVKIAGLGVAMGNGVEEIKNVANYITDTNENDGVAKVIDKYILNDNI
ncbi:Cof-type HAD-IIB family hydrolase [uncultured Tyzzerella sp.]|uniref:Cof-type HAD-IIB family hydrolase n=1 Tax=uncultured Tyzzerella sp. TaxID=2321398 RepID=UPI0029438B75|nr:Cof-type HAD-IIB family hydrolase [uncultured Tyzzerella sp.]